jgi:hypothetical protein
MTLFGRVLSKMRDYNGFSSNERAKVGRLQLEAIRSGKFPKPTKCELCGASEGQLQLHNEDYSKPFDDAHPICRSCHLALHVRFTNPERWDKRKAYIRVVRGNGDYWWDKLINAPIDINPAHSRY